jgi:glutathione peroxidase-family protein
MTAASLVLSCGIGYGREGEMKTIYDFTMRDINGVETPLANFKGKVVLVVNVASRCGFTPQYEGLEALYLKYKDKGFVVLGFPANNFLWQEPGTDAEIKGFCTTKYNVTFPLFSKISVKGKDQHPLYQWLTSKESHPEQGGGVSWNFNKFLIGPDGHVVARFGSRESPLSDNLQNAIISALHP